MIIIKQFHFDYTPSFPIYIGEYQFQAYLIFMIMFFFNLKSGLPSYNEIQ